MQKHPDVLAEYESRVLADPDTCWHPYGAVSATASNPKPQWCVKRVGHSGGHSDAAREERERERHARNQAAYRERQKLKLREHDNGLFSLRSMGFQGMRESGYSCAEGACVGDWCAWWRDDPGRA